MSATELRNEIMNVLDNSDFIYKGELYRYDGDELVDTGYIPDLFFKIEKYYDIELDEYYCSCLENDLCNDIHCDIYNEKTWYKIYFERLKDELNKLIDILERRSVNCSVKKI